MDGPRSALDRQEHHWTGWVSLREERTSPGVLVLRIDRPDCRNAVDRPLVDALIAAVDGATEAVVVLTSSEPSCFCAGVDLRLGDAERAAVSDRLYELYQAMVGSTSIIIGVAQGQAVGGGVQLLLASDMRIGSPSTRLRLAGPGHGLAVGAWALPALVGRGRAMDLCLSLRAVDADEAAAIGLLDRVVPDADAVALEIAAAVASLQPDAVRRVKSIVNTSAPVAKALALERAENARWSGSIEGLLHHAARPSREPG
jgi:enoyl-CoA hydratase/carnithine racemase